MIPYDSTSLIFDVGLHVGHDTAYYLQLGHRVVAIEANPALIDQAKERFSSEIASGKLILESGAIGTVEGEIDFWVCDNDSGLSSFDRDLASRLGHVCHSVRVPATRLSTLFQKHGVPYYLKVDIEGMDHAAVSDLPVENLPPYISMELNSVDDFILLKQKGYRQFKCVQQGPFTQITAEALNLSTIIRPHLRNLKSSRIANFLRQKIRLTSLARSAKAPANSNGWQFSMHSSGPLGEQVPGKWQDFDYALHAWLDHRHRNTLGYESWFDLHARLAPG